MEIPKVFVSYSHDSQSHKKWVLDLAVRLRSSGIDAILDQWELGPGDDLPHFMDSNLAKCDRVIMVCTSKYVDKANSGAGGVGYEKMIITADLMKGIDSNKVIPVIRQEGGHLVPTFLKSKLFIDFSTEDRFEFAFDELVRSILRAPLFIKPPIGDNPFVSVEDNQPEPQVDTLKEVMRHVVLIFEDQSWNHVSYNSLVNVVNISRLLLDVNIEEAKQQGLLTQDINNDVRLTTKGKQYAIHHNLIKS